MVPPLALYVKDFLHNEHTALVFSLVKYFQTGDRLGLSNEAASEGALSDSAIRIRTLLGTDAVWNIRIDSDGAPFPIC